ncbi:MAG: glutathione-dependent formaldehyde dehydrogenase [Methylotenera sp.]|nr:glutathione-dependent formaldehyde dehydrogenase [Oligoflexia bacterium]
MLAMTYRGPYRVRLDEKPIPQIEHPNDAIIRVTRTCLCGSDLHIYHGLLPDTRIGSTFGHEFVGVVEEVGPTVQSLKPGDRVGVPFNISCGSCFFCKKSLYGNCENTNPNSSIGAGFFGYSHTTGGYDGGQAEYVRVPFADVGPFKIPDGMSEDDAVLLTDVFPTGYQAAEMGDIKAGDTVIVFGAGPVGIFAAKSAWLMGAGRVIVVDQADYRLEFVQNYAQVETVNFAQVDDIIMTLKKMTDWRGADVCIDAVGAEADGDWLQTLAGVRMKLSGGATTALGWAIESCRKAGNVSIVGVYGPPINLVPMGTAMNKGLTMRMNQCNVKRYLPRLIEHVMSGRVKPSDIITHRVPLEEVSDAYHRFSSKLDHCIKTVLIPPKAA